MAKNILVVDDNKDIVYTVTRNLKQIAPQYKFFEVYSGKDAFKILEAEKIDLVLLDIMMPEMDGWEVARQMKKLDKTKNIPIVFLTARTDEFSKKMGALSASDYVEKPFDPIDLKKRIVKILGE